MHRGDLLLRAAASEGCVVPSGHEIQLVTLEDITQLRRPPWELPPELDARVTGLPRLPEAGVERDVVTERFQVVVGPADGVDADSNRHPSLQLAGAAAPGRTIAGRRGPRAGPRPRGPERPTRLRP